MTGMVLGDIAGSKWEFRRADSYYFDGIELFQPDSFFTDNTVMACATKYAILNQITYADAYKLFYKMFPKNFFGNTRFTDIVLERYIKSTFLMDIIRR